MKSTVPLDIPAGNPWTIIERCAQVAQRAGWTKEEIDSFRVEALVGDYPHLKRVVAKYFHEVEEKEY